MCFNFQVLLELKKATPIVQSVEMRTQWWLKPVACEVVHTAVLVTDLRPISEVWSYLSNLMTKGEMILSLITLELNWVVEHWESVYYYSKDKTPSRVGGETYGSNKWMLSRNKNQRNGETDTYLSVKPETLWSNEVRWPQKYSETFAFLLEIKGKWYISSRGIWLPNETR